MLAYPCLANNVESMDLSQHQKDYLNKLGITPWQSRNNMPEDATESSRQLNPEPSNAEPLDSAVQVVTRATDETVTAAPKQETDWLIVTSSKDFPDWWEKFMVLFGDKVAVANSTLSFDYQYGLIFDEANLSVKAENSIIHAPDFNAFNEHPELKKELWLTLKQWL